MAIAAAIPPTASGLKVLPLAAGSKSPAYAPTIENLQAGNYPLCLPLLLVFKPARLAALGVAMEFLHSDEAARRFEQSDVAPLPRSIRIAQWRELTAGSTPP